MVSLSVLRGLIHFDAAVSWFLRCFCLLLHPCHFLGGRSILVVTGIGNSGGNLFLSCCLVLEMTPPRTPVAAAALKVHFLVDGPSSHVWQSVPDLLDIAAQWPETLAARCGLLGVSGILPIPALLSWGCCAVLAAPWRFRWVRRAAFLADGLPSGARRFSAIGPFGEMPQEDDPCHKNPKKRQS